MFNSAYVPISTPTTSTSTSTSTPEATPVETSVHNELAAETKTKTAESDSLTNGSLQEILELEDVSIIDVDAPSTNCLQPVDHGKPPDVSSSTIPVELAAISVVRKIWCTKSVVATSMAQNLVRKICCGYINGAQNQP
ncbi:hypothetical protein V6N12_002780 [Hibiscus sabdariffa]|uniref:Uncharacterized protein n=1 Tax=Hibiscus sabdariffa TaxID=183260 RepID=A0ABR2EBT0_9ROSI